MHNKILSRFTSMAALAMILTAGSPAFAATVTGDPSQPGGVSASVPVSASVADYVEINFNACAFGAVAGASGSSASCTDAITIASNTNANVAFSSTQLTHSVDSTKHLDTTYSVDQNAGIPQTFGPDLNDLTNSASFTQNAAPLNTLTTYNLSGTATIIDSESIAGSYSANVTVTVTKI